MPRNTTLGKIEKDLERLTTQDQLKLLERLAHQLRGMTHGGRSPASSLNSWLPAEVYPVLRYGAGMTNRSKPRGIKSIEIEAIGK